MWPTMSIWTWYEDGSGDLVASLDPQDEIEATTIAVPGLPARLEHVIRGCIRADRLEAGRMTGPWPELPLWVWSAEDGEIWACSDKTKEAPACVLLDVPRDKGARDALRTSCETQLVELKGVRSASGARPKIVGLPAVPPVASPTVEPPAHGSELSKWKQTCRHIVAALIDERETVRSRRSSTDVSLSEGQEITRTAERVVMRFMIGTEVADAPGSDVQVELAGFWNQAELIGVAGNLCTLAIPTAARLATEGRLRLDAAHLIELQIERFDALSADAGEFDVDAALAVLSPASTLPLGAPVVDTAHPLPSSDHLNGDQVGAILSGLRSGCSWFWGPPGTGKTTTVARLVETLRRGGKRVLVVSNTNAAVDAALASYLEALTADAPTSAAEVLRVGMSASPALCGFKPHPVGRVQRRGV